MHCNHKPTVITPYLGFFHNLEEVLLRYPEGGKEGDFFLNGETVSIWIWDTIDRKWVDGNRPSHEVIQGIVDNPLTFVPTVRLGIRAVYLYTTGTIGEHRLLHFSNEDKPLCFRIDRTSIVTLYWDGSRWEAYVAPIALPLSLTGAYTEYRFARNTSPVEKPFVDTSSINPGGDWYPNVPLVNEGEYVWMTCAQLDGRGGFYDEFSRWSEPIRLTAVDGMEGMSGVPGATGVSGATIRMRGIWMSEVAYGNNPLFRDVVLYKGVHYITRREIAHVQAGILPTETSYWESFVEFDNVATKVLLAENAWINVLDTQGIRIGTEGWVLSKGEIYHTASGLRLTHDGKLQVPSGKFVIDNRSFEALSAEMANEYANAYAKITMESANAYADGLITAEEARAIADAQAKADEARQAAIEAAQSDINDKSAQLQALTAIAQTEAEGAAAAAGQAESIASSVSSKLTLWASDAYISPTEKETLKQSRAFIESDYQSIVHDVLRYEITGTLEWSDYYSIYLVAITTLEKYTATIPEEIAVEADYEHINTYYSSRKIILDAIAVTAKNHVDNIQVGGVNLLRSSKGDSLEGWAQNGENAVRVGDQGITNYDPVFGFVNKTSIFQQRTLVAGRYTFSCFSQQDRAWLSINIINSDWSKVIKHIEINSSLRFEECFELSEDITNAVIMMENSNTAEGSYAWVARMKLEQGNKATAWDRAIEDIEQHFAQVESRIALTESGIEQRVKRGEVESIISQSPEMVAVRAGNITLSGETKIAEGGFSVGDKFKVDTDGSFEAKNAIISGVINANSGKIGVFSVKDNGITVSNENKNVSIINTEIPTLIKIAGFYVRIPLYAFTVDRNSYLNPSLFTHYFSTPPNIPCKFYFGGLQLSTTLAYGNPASSWRFYLGLERNVDDTWIEEYAIVDFRAWQTHGDVSWYQESKTLDLQSNSWYRIVMLGETKGVGGNSPTLEKVSLVKDIHTAAYSTTSHNTIGTNGMASYFGDNKYSYSAVEGENLIITQRGVIELNSPNNENGIRIKDDGTYIKYAGFFYPIENYLKLPHIKSIIKNIINNP